MSTTSNSAEPAQAGPGRDAGDLTCDDFLGGRVRLLQPAKGYRAGIDAVLLAAAAPVAGDGPSAILDVGAGVGTIGICVAARVPGARVVLLERDPILSDIARRNIAANGFDARVRVLEADINDRTGLAAALDDTPDASFTHVLANPPYHDATAGTASGLALKAAAHAMAPASLDVWVRFLARMAAADASMTMIHKAAALPEILAAADGRFGALRVLPIHPRPGMAANRILVQGRKGSRAPLTLLPGLVLHEASGHAFTPAADAILRQGMPLAMA